MNDIMNSWDKTRYFAAYSNDVEIVRNSSSGGLFFELGREILELGGVVYGAAMSDIEIVTHIRVDDLSDLYQIQKSKYLMSDIGDCYEDAQENLKNGKFVLFSGTPCQINGLKVFLDAYYEKLLTVEVVCHGMPLTNAFRKYVNEKEINKGNKLVGVDFRDKTYGWNNNAIREVYEGGQEELCFSSIHPIHSLYLKGINMQARCGSCSFAKKDRVSDITLADFWKYKGNIEKTNENLGISLIAINSANGAAFFERIKNSIVYDEVSEQLVIDSCRHFSNAPYLDVNQEVFSILADRNDISFRNSAELCTLFGNVIASRNLHKLINIDEKSIVRFFLEDPQEIIYIVDHDGSISAIVTLGMFLNNYDSGNITNDAFNYVRVDDEFIVLKVKNIFSKNSKISRIPVLDNEGRLLFEVRKDTGTKKKIDYRIAEYAFKKLRALGIRCYFFGRPETIEGYSYNHDQVRRIGNKRSFNVMVEERTDEDIYDLKHIIGDRYTEEYLRDLCRISPILKRGKKYQHLDTNTHLVNVQNGHRRTCYEPDDYYFKIHIFGRCGAFGYAVEDRDTMPAKLQKKLKDLGVLVINHGIRGAEDYQIISNIVENVFDGTIDSKDIVILYGAFFRNIEDIEKLEVYIKDTTSAFHESLTMNKGIDFYDKVGHMNAAGYDFIADYIFDEIEADILNQKEHSKQKAIVDGIPQGEYLDDKQKNELDKYLRKVKEEISDTISYGDKIGAVVVNCNPFSKGHRYLIESAKQVVDVLLIFVVEEDKSIFPFKERIDMVRKGVSDIENVFVFPSGKYMISEYTLPDYFFRNMQKNKMIDMSLDVHVFGKYIAPYLGIKYRFVGSEQDDDDTYYYNECMKRVLPDYGIEYKEVERLVLNGKKISASEIRNVLFGCQKKEEKIKQLEGLLPETSIEFLVNNKYL